MNAIFDTSARIPGTMTRPTRLSLTGDSCRPAAELSEHGAPVPRHRVPCCSSPRTERTPPMDLWRDPCSELSTGTTNPLEPVTDRKNGVGIRKPHKVCVVYYCSHRLDQTNDESRGEKKGQRIFRFDDMEGERSRMRI
jgi:hypothetical protein